MANFTLLDIFGILHALPFFALTFLAPGYCLGRITNVLRFHQRSAAEQWLLSMGLSIVVTPYCASFGRFKLPPHGFKWSETLLV